VLVVDGDSSDATREIAREYDATIVPEGGESIATARNLGAERASGEWLAFVDADTRVRANYLTELLGFVEPTGSRPPVPTVESPVPAERSSWR